MSQTETRCGATFASVEHGLVRCSRAQHSGDHLDADADFTWPSARPTPPSDAGTSERETRETPREAAKDAHAIVSAMLAAHNADPRVRVPLPIPAAPAAEGPRAEQQLTPVLCSVCSGPIIDNQISIAEKRHRLCSRAAALPGAEAGTLDTMAGLTRYRTSRAERRGMTEAVTGEWLSFSEVADRLAALTSEVRDQTAKARAMWEDREGWKRTAAERGFEVTRLTSEVRALREVTDDVLSAAAEVPLESKAFGDALDALRKARGGSRA